MKPQTRNLIPRLACAVLFTATAIWSVRADYPSTLLSHGPIGYWQFGETAPSPAPFKLANSGSLGSTVDAYGIPSLTNGVTGKVGNAISFNNPVGTAHAGSRADVVYNAGLNTKVFSVEFWVQPSAQTLSGAFDATGACPLSNFNPNNFAGGRVGWLFYLAPNGQWNFRLGLSSGYAANLIATSGTAAAGVWQHMAATYDGSVVRLYANGVLISSASSPAASTGWVPNTGSFLRFGGTPLPGDNAYTTADGNYYLPWDQNVTVSGNRGFDGLVDEVAIYTNVLSASTIAAHYSAAATPGTYDATILADNPAGYWNFDEAAVTRPGPSSFPTAANAGSLGSAADGTNVWGAVAAQSGPGYTGFPAGNKAVTFDGMNGSFIVKNAAGLHISNNITLAAWVKPLAANYIHNIIEHGPDGVGNETFLRIDRGDGYGTGKFYEVGSTEGAQNDGWYDAARTAVPPGDIGNWVFLVGTFDGANWKLYRNGVLSGTTPAYANPIAPDFDTGAIDVTNTWTIGSRALPSDVDGNYFAGSVDEPAIFTNVLSASDIAALYAAAQVPPVITRAPVNPGTVFKGNNVSFTVFADGSPTLGFMWTSNGLPTGVTTTNYTITSIPIGTYTIGVIVTNAYGTNSPSVTFSAIAAPPSIVTPIHAETRFVGYNFDFTVSAAGSSPLTYFWKLGNTVVQSGSSPTYSGTASLGNAGNYSVVVSNETGVLITNGPVALVVNPIPSNYGGAVIGSTPIAYWRLDEASGSVAFDGIAGIDGIYNSTTLGVPGYSVIDPDTAVSFNGVNSYVGSISGTAINFPGHTNFSLEAWVNAPAGQNDEATIIAKGIGNVGTTRTEQFSVDVAGGVYRFFTSSGTAAILEADATVGPNGSWQHIVAVYDDGNTLGSGSNMFIYVNGQLQGQHAVRAAGLVNTTSALSIGSKRTGNDPKFDGTFNGVVDEVAIYNYALSPSTIQAHYAAAYGSSLAPFINVQPTSTTNYAGLPASLSVSAAGTVPLTYQWKKNNVDIPGATDSSLSFTSLTAGDQASYSVGITNSVNPGTNSVTVFLAVLPPPTSPPSISGLVLHLPFENNLTDVTGRGNDGIYIHTTTNVVAGGGSSNVFTPDFKPDGMLGSALHYSTEATNTGGTTSVGTNDFYVTLGVRPDLQFGSNISFSVAYWIRLPLGFIGGDLPFVTDTVGSLGGNGYVFATAYGYGTADPNPTTPPQNYGGWGMSVYGGGAGVRLYGDPGSINNNNWHHLVHVIDRPAGTITTYLDGALAHYSKNAGTTVAAAGNINTTAATVIGQDPTGRYGEDGSGDIDDLGIWRKALTPLEAASIYAAGAFSGLSFTNTATSLPSLTIQPLAGGKVKVTWSLGTLQSATTVTGPYSDVVGATSPLTNTATAVKFYRTKL